MSLFIGVREPVNFNSLLVLGGSITCIVVVVVVVGETELFTPAT